LPEKTKSDQTAPDAQPGAAQWATAAQAMLASGQAALAVNLALKIRNEAAGDPEALLLASEVLSRSVPSWHFKLVRDHLRNAAYDAALRRAIRPGMRVLDIGSGTGLLAMMAARAGAAQVFTCEMNPAIADAAREIVARNGFSNRIQVLARHSTTLDAAVDLGGRVDLIVSEIIAKDMLSEDVLPTMEHAVGHLLNPNGQVIPARGSVKIALAFDPRLHERRMSYAEGFDIEPFNRLAAPSYGIKTTEKLELRSETANLFAFDFGAADPVPPARTQTTLVGHAGTVNCIAQWIHLQMDEVGTHENSPADPVFSSWAVVVHPFSGTIEANAGGTFQVSASHDRASLRIWPSRQPVA
jgi:protein arginine N-methyltransferase 7